MADSVALIVFIQALLKAIVCYGMADLGLIILPLVLGSTLIIDYYLIDYVTKYIRD